MIVDSHCHLDDPAFDGDRPQVLERARAAGVGLILTIGTGDGPPDLEPAVRLAGQHSNVYATAGVHPHDARKADAAAFDRLVELCSRQKVLAVGEIGLDFHYDDSPREIQREVFIKQMEVAREARKPIVIHTRDAWPETLDLLEQYWRPTGLRGIMHCFSGGYEQAKRSVDCGFMIAFGGMLTFKHSDELRRTAARLPLDSLLLETDAPYLTPAPYRKIRRNEPCYVAETLRKLAEVRQLDHEAVAQATTENFCWLFDLPVPAMDV